MTISAQSIADKAKTIQAVMNECDQQVTLVAVTKYVDADAIAMAVEAGITDVGENKPHDALAKMEILPKALLDKLTWHFIGHLQTNKVNKVVGNFALIHSVDSLRLAEKISQRAIDLEIKQEVLLQVNVAEEEAKHGFSVEEVESVFEKLVTLEGINILGLMTMAPFVEEDHVIDSTFKKLFLLREKLQRSNDVILPELSMGMSQDYVHALKNGATIVRVGSYLFS